MEDIGFNGMGSKFNSRFEAGAPIQAKQLNDLAAGVQASLPMPYLGDGTSVSFTPGGSIIVTNSVRAQLGNALLQQFQIVPEQYFILDIPIPDVSIIRVVKGEVVWFPKFAVVEGVPSPDSCVTQTTIENWYALPTFPIIDDQSSAFIGDGGIVVPNSPNLEIGIYVFKVNNLPLFDVPPIIVATPEWAVTCPVVPPPGFPEYPDMFPVWEVVKIGSLYYETPNPESDPPIPGGWQITQNFIGSMTLPGGGGGGGGSNLLMLPAQLPSTEFPEQTTPQPFECRIVIDDFPNAGEMILKIGQGSISHTKSNMPFVGNGCTIEKRQTAYTKLQVSPVGWSAPGDEANSGWINLGGGYKITGEGQWYLIAFNWDVEQGGGDTNFPLPDPLKAGAGTEVGLPVLALIDALGPDVAKLFRETGPGLYTNTMNIQKMTGYSNVGPGENDDWGYCHTTYFNPIKLGYDIKVIAEISSVPADLATVEISVSQLATAVRNQIQNIYLPVLPKSGSVVFAFTTPGNPTAIPPIPPVTYSSTPWDPPIGNSADSSCLISLFNALQFIPPLQGNIMVTATSRNNFYVTFINQLQASNQILLVATPTLLSWPFEYKIDQLITGNVVLDAGPQFDGTQLMNKANLTKNDDPYIIQSEASPAFTDIVNLQDALDCNGLNGDTNFSVGLIPISPFNPTTHQWKYETENGCSDENECKHPFYVKTVPNVDPAQLPSYSVCTGTVNNIVPTGVDSPLALADGDSVWIKCQVEAGNSNTYPFMVAVESGATMPINSDTFGYIKIAQVSGTEINQFVTGSLWTDRIKLGSSIASYYFARV